MKKALEWIYYLDINHLINFLTTFLFNTYPSQRGDRSVVALLNQKVVLEGEIPNFVQPYHVHREFCSLVLGILYMNYKLEWFTRSQFEVLWALNICAFSVYVWIDRYCQCALLPLPCFPRTGVRKLRKYCIFKKIFNMLIKL